MHRKGSSLLELVVVLAIAAILVAVALFRGSPEWRGICSCGSPVPRSCRMSGISQVHAVGEDCY